MRILALVSDAFGGYGGIAQYNRDLFSALSLSRHVREIVVIPRLSQGDLKALPDKLRQLEPRSSRTAYVARSVGVAARQGPFDLVFSGHIYHTPLAALIARWLDVPLWLQTHGIDAWQKPDMLIRSATDRCDLVTTVSRYTKRRLLSWANIAPERVRVLPNTFRPMFAPGKRDPSCLEKFGLSGAKIILTVSRLSQADHYKGHTRVLDVLPRVLSQHPEAHYVIVGGGDARQGLEQQVAARGLSGAVSFLGRLSDAEVLRLYQSSDVFVMPSTKEGFGIVFVEAAASGLRVVGGNCDGSVDALADGDIGIAVDPEVPEDLVRAIDDALCGRSKLGVEAVQRFAFPNFAAHVDDIVGRFAR